MLWLYVPVFAVILVILSWFVAVLFLHDFSVRSFRPTGIKKVLVVFPHPDDETNIAGTIWKLRKQGAAVTIAVLTKGERGTPDAHLDSTLKATRGHEMHVACDCLHHTNLIQEDFGDGQLDDKQDTVRKYISKLLASEQPDLVITYDRAGLYGHPDHIVCAEITTELLRDTYPNTALWYTTPPKRMLAMAHLPTQMATDPQFAQKRAVATMKIFTGRGVMARIKTVYAHKSQRLSIASSTPLHLPIWLVHSLQVFEYFEVVR